MKSLRQQHVDMVGQIAADEALVAEGKHELETHRAKERLPRLRDQRATLETDIELAAAAQNQLSTALTNLRTVANRDRELSLAITHAEDALHRTQLHLGTAADLSKPAEASAPLPPRVPQPKPFER